MANNQKKADLRQLIDNGNYKIKYLYYNWDLNTNMWSNTATPPHPTPSLPFNYCDLVFLNHSYEFFFYP